jgi:hypothetical protein
MLLVEHRIEYSKKEIIKNYYFRSTNKLDSNDNEILELNNNTYVNDQIYKKIHLFNERQEQ